MAFMKNQGFVLKGAAAGLFLSAALLVGCEKAAVVAELPDVTEPVVAAEPETPKDQAAAQLRSNDRAANAGSAGLSPQETYEARKQARAERMALEAQDREAVAVPQPVRPEYQGRLDPSMKPPQ